MQVVGRVEDGDTVGLLMQRLDLLTLTRVLIQNITQNHSKLFGLGTVTNLTVTNFLDPLWTVTNFLDPHEL